jgi:hypothetical protein
LSSFNEVVEEGEAKSITSAMAEHKEDEAREKPKISS